MWTHLIWTHINPSHLISSISIISITFKYSKSKKIGQKSKIWTFYTYSASYCKTMLPSQVIDGCQTVKKQLLPSSDAISMICNQPKVKKSSKTSFSKIFEKWLSLEAWWPLEIQGTLKCPKFRFSPFIFANWTILSDLEHNLFFRKISTDGRFWPVQAYGEKKLNMFPIFPGPEIFREGSSHYYLTFLRVSAKSLAWF